MTKDKYPHLQDQRDLWDIHKRNCHAAYLEDSGIADWQARCCCMLVSASEYMAGLGSSPGTAFPVQISISCKFQNKCAFLDGIKYSDSRAAGALLHRDYISSRAVVVGIFDKQIMQIASSAMVLSAQNFTQSTTAALLMGRT